MILFPKVLVIKHAVYQRINSAAYKGQISICQVSLAREGPSALNRVHNVDKNNRDPTQTENHHCHKQCASHLNLFYVCRDDWIPGTLEVVTVTANCLKDS